jgi:hypothetical protein
MKTFIIILLAMASSVSMAATTIELNLPNSAIQFNSCSVGFNSIGPEDTSFLYASCKSQSTMKPFYTYSIGIFYEEIIVDGQEFYGCELSRFVQSNNDTLLQVNCPQ